MREDDLFAAYSLAANKHIVEAAEIPGVHKCMFTGCPTMIANRSIRVLCRFHERSVRERLYLDLDPNARDQRE